MITELKPGDRVAHPSVIAREGTVRSLTGDSVVVGWEHHDEQGRLIHVTEGWHSANSVRLVQKVEPKPTVSTGKIKIPVT